MTDSFSVRVGEFKGPLPLLLELVEKRELPISQVSLAAVADRFIEYVRGLPQSSKDQLTEFIVVASTLMLIKSISLLPALPLAEGENEEIGQLEARLKVYRLIRDASLLWQKNWGRQTIFYPEPRRQEIVFFSPTNELTVTNLSSAIKNLIQALPQLAPTLPRLVVKKIVSLEEMIEDLARRVQTALRLNFSQFLQNKSADWRKEKTNIIVSFLALLELCKQGLVEVEQRKNFEEIKIGTKMAETPRY